MRPQSGMRTSPGWRWGITSQRRLPWQGFFLISYYTGKTRWWRPGAIKVGMGEPLNLDHTVRLEALVAQRAALFQRWMPMAKRNLQIAQHRDTRPQVCEDAQRGLEAQPGSVCSWGLCVPPAGNAAHTRYAGGGQYCGSGRWLQMGCWSWRGLTGGRCKCTWNSALRATGPM
jgi:hypothetical protein